MTPDPSVGVVLTVWNRPMFIWTAACAVRGAGYNPLIVDDASDDEYTLREMDRLRADGFEVFRCEKNVGHDMAEHIALEAFAKQGCDVLVSMEDAAWLLPGSLEEMVAVLRSDNCLGVVGPALDVTLIPEQFNDLLAPAVSTPDFRRACRDGYLGVAGRLLPPLRKVRWRTTTFVDSCCWAISADCWRATGGTDPAFWMGWGMCNEFCYRAREAGFHSAVVPGAFAHMADRAPEHMDCPWARPGAYRGLPPGDIDEFRQTWVAAGERRLAEKYGSVERAYALFRGKFVPLIGMTGNRGTD
jgi:GT2 family glycosyltransferase